MTAAEIDRVRAFAESHFNCDCHSVHGPAHWQNVEDTVASIAHEVGGNLLVGRLFAILHDCCRLDDGADLNHGPRAAALIRQLSGEMLKLSPEDLDLLLYAVEHHTDGMVSADPTVGACWDSDRLDLGRVGVVPSSKYMSTAPGRKIANGIQMPTRY